MTHADGKHNVVCPETNTDYQEAPFFALPVRLFTVEADASLCEVADRMVRGQLPRLLVVKPNTRRDIVGIVSAIDLLEWVRDRAAPSTDPE